MASLVSIKESEATRERLGIPKARNESALQEAIGPFGAVDGPVGQLNRSVGAIGMWLEEAAKASWSFGKDMVRRARGDRGYRTGGGF